MMCMDILSRMQQEMRTVLEANILSFWVDKMQDSVHGGFYGRITGTDKLEPQAVKGAVLNARILWTFSSAYRLLKSPDTWNGYPCQTCHYRPILRQGTGWNILVARLYRPSLGYQKANLCFRFCHLRSE